MTYVESEYQLQLDHKVEQLTAVLLRIFICHIALLLSVTAVAIGVNVMSCSVRCNLWLSILELAFGSTAPDQFYTEDKKKRPRHLCSSIVYEERVCETLLSPSSVYMCV